MFKDKLYKISVTILIQFFLLQPAFSQNQSIIGDCNVQIHGERNYVGQVNCQLSEEEIADIIERGDIKKIEQLRLSVKKFTQALGRSTNNKQSAIIGFFKSTKNNPEIYGFLSKFFKDGLDPNEIIWTGEEQFTTLFWASIDSGNADIAKFLLKSGANPHTPESIIGSTRYLPRFAWATEYIIKNATALTKPERYDIIKEMETHGAIISYEDILTARPTILPIADTKTVCQDQYLSICKNPILSTKIDWCDFIKKYGLKKRNFEIVKGISIMDYVEFKPKYVISITKSGNVWIRGDTDKNFSNLAILSINPNNDWQIFAYTRDGCRKEFNYDCWLMNKIDWNPDSHVLTTSYGKEIQSNKYCN